jgi:hypothetical protein
MDGWQNFRNSPCTGHMLQVPVGSHVNPQDSEGLDLWEVGGVGVERSGVVGVEESGVVDGEGSGVVGVEGSGVVVVSVDGGVGGGGISVVADDDADLLNARNLSLNMCCFSMSVFA